MKKIERYLYKAEDGSLKSHFTVDEIEKMLGLCWQDLKFMLINRVQTSWTLACYGILIKPEYIEFVPLLNKDINKRLREIKEVEKAERKLKFKKFLIKYFPFLIRNKIK